MKKYYLGYLIFIFFRIGFVNAQYTVLHSFNDTNGGAPTGSLTLFENKLYGMTSAGGASGNGIIFSIDTKGTEFRDLLDFDNTDGLSPAGNLTMSGKVLFGMTTSGGLLS